MAKLQRSLTCLALLGACVLGSGCVPALLKQRPDGPDTATPARFPGQAEVAASATPDPSQALGLRDWSDFFPSPALRQLIGQALHRNQELKAQIQELVVAQNEVMARRGEYRPKLRLGASAGLDRVGAHTPRGMSDEALGLPQNLGDFAFGLVGSWEVDVWGKLRNEADAAQFRYLASVEGRRFMATQVVAELARSYYELLALDTKLAVLKRNIALQQQALAMVRVEKQAARVTELAVQRFVAEILKNQSVANDLQQARVQAENRINFLVGRFPQTVARRPEDLQSPLPRVLRTGLPSALLSNRPDLRQAELALGAAKLDLKAARAAFFPALSIEAGLGYRAFNPAHLVATPESLVGNLGGSLTAPLLNRAAIEAHYRGADARQVQAVIQYERAILQAYTDVANQIANVKHMTRSHEQRAQQVATLKRSVEVSNLLFRAARADYVEVLLTRRDLLDAEMELIERRMLMQQAVVGLYQALGGGWRQDPLDPLASPRPAASPRSVASPQPAGPAAVVPPPAAPQPAPAASPQLVAPNRP